MKISFSLEVVLQQSTAWIKTLKFIVNINYSRFELSLYGCVQVILGRDAGCSMADVEQIMTQDEVRRGLLDSVSPDYCGKSLQEYRFRHPKKIVVLILIFEQCGYTMEQWVQKLIQRPTI